MHPLVLKKKPEGFLCTYEKKELYLIYNKKETGGTYERKKSIPQSGTEGIFP